MCRRVLAGASQYFLSNGRIQTSEQLVHDNLIAKPMNVQQRQPFLIDLIALGSFLLLVLVFFWKSVFGLGVIGSVDLIVRFYPYKAYIRDLINQGELPLWDPLIYLGAPLLANIQAAVLYPPDFLFTLFSFPSALTWSVVLHIWWALAGMYLFLRYGLGTTVFAAWVGALCFGLGGFLLPHIGQVNVLHTAVWLPWLLLCAIRASTSPTPTWLILGGIATAFSFTAGHTQEFYYSILIMGLFCAYSALVSPNGESSRWWPLFVPVVFLLIGGILSAAQLLPTLEAAIHSFRRGGLPLEESAALAVSPNEILFSLFPRYWALPGIEVVGYIGIGGAILTFFGALQVTRQRWVLFFILIALLAFVLALGTYTPLFTALHTVLPGFSLFRVPARWLFLVSFSLSTLAAFGADRLRDDLRPEERRQLSLKLLLGTLVATILLVAYIGRLYLIGSEQSLPDPKVVVFWATTAVIIYATILLVLHHGLANLLAYLTVGGIVLVELFFASRPLEFNQVMPPEIYTHSETTQQLSQHWTEARYISIAAERFPLENEEARRQELLESLSEAWVQPAIVYGKYSDELRPNLNLPLGMSTADGHDGGLLPSRYYADLRGALLNDMEFPPHQSLSLVESDQIDARLWGLVSVRYLVTDHQQTEPGTGWELIGQARTDGPLLFENNEVLPRAFVVYETVVDDDPLRLRTIDVARQVLVERPIPELVGVTGEPVAATIVSESALRVEIQATTSQPGLLVLSDSYFPGWIATVNGSPREIHRVDIALRGVLLPSGEHTIVFEYQPRWFQIGVVVSLIGWLLALALLLPRLMRRTPKRFPNRM